LEILARLIRLETQMRFNRVEIVVVGISLFLQLIGCQSRLKVETLNVSGKKETKCVTLGIIDESECAMFVFTNEQLGLTPDCDVISSSCDCISIAKEGRLNVNNVASSVFVVRHVSPISEHDSQSKNHPRGTLHVGYVMRVYGTS
jgi:hypothetical protein